MREKRNKIIFLFLQLSYNAILHVELHCSTIAKFFAIMYVRTQFVTNRNRIGFAHKKGPNNIICRARV